MKRLLTLILVFAACFTTFAQIPPGSTAPNFTATDVNGRTWNLYDLLESGRPVIMDVSATWCGPCWNYHINGALETYYELHGPEGDGKSMVFWVEGDGSTNLNCMYGPTGCVGGTQGNWVANTPFPMFDNAQIAADYQIGYYPTIYLICPDKTVREVGQLTATNLWAQANPCAANIPERWGKITTMKANERSLQLCGSQTLHPEFDMANLGTSPIASMKIELRWNGQVVETVNYTDEIHVLDGIHVDFADLTINGAGVLAAEIVEINGQPNGANSLTEITFTEAEPAYTQQVEVRIRADVNAKDIFWAVYDENGQIFDQGGNQAVGPNGGGQYPGGSPAGTGAYNNNANVRDTINIPGDCFTFHLVDGAGDGLKAPGNIKLFNLGSTTSFASFANNFGATLGKGFSKSTSGTNNISPVGELTVFPNPAAASLTVSYDLGASTEVNFVVTNTIGQVVYSRNGGMVNAGEQQTEIPVAALTNGLYFLQIQTNLGNAIAKPFVVAH